MRKYLLLISSFLFVACSAPQDKSVVTIPEGIEPAEFFNLVYCGDPHAFNAALVNVSRKLDDAWNAIEGKESTKKCTIRIKTDVKGYIVNYQIVECSSPSKIRAALNKASPVPVPKNKCILNAINRVKYILNEKQIKTNNQIINPS